MFGPKLQLHKRLYGRFALPLPYELNKKIISLIEVGLQYYSLCHLQNAEISHNQMLVDYLFCRCPPRIAVTKSINDTRNSWNHKI